MLGPDPAAGQPCDPGFSPGPLSFRLSHVGLMEPNWQGCRKASTPWALGACPGPAARTEDHSLSVPGAWAGGGGSAGWGGSFLLGDSSQGSWEGLFGPAPLPASWRCSSGAYHLCPGSLWGAHPTSQGQGRMPPACSGPQTPLLPSLSLTTHCHPLTRPWPPESSFSITSACFRGH